MPRSEWQNQAKLVREISSSTPDLGRGTMNCVLIQTNQNNALHFISSTIYPGEEIDKIQQNTDERLQQ